MAKVIEPRRSNWSAMGGRSWLVVPNHEYGYRGGFIITPYGLVGLYDQMQSPLTGLTFVYRGRHHTATWYRTFSDRYLKTLATRFAAEIVQQEGEP